MLVMILAMLFLSMLYLSNMFYKRKMRVALVSIVLFWAVIISWVYALLVLDVAQLGFLNSEERINFLYEFNPANIVRFLNEKSNVINTPVIKTIISVSTLAVTLGIVVVMHGVFEMTKEFICAASHLIKKAETRVSKKIFTAILPPMNRGGILIMICRLNC
ncbi:MAG: hypothetical protein IJS71_00490 [Clostridia bacterium]|nr:hypothetical protein [Clostridia bacterium]